MPLWDITSSILSVITATTAIPLGVGCLWPTHRPPRTACTPAAPRCPLPPTTTAISSASGSAPR